MIRNYEIVYIKLRKGQYYIKVLFIVLMLRGYLFEKYKLSIYCMLGIRLDFEKILMNYMGKNFFLMGF